MSIIAISRGTFSGGEGLARRVAERLGYRCLSREANLETVAKLYAIPPEDLMAAMDKRPSFWHRVAGERTAYLAYVRATLCEQAKSGSLVYHGLAGHLMLPGISHVIRVRVIADADDRVKAAMQQQNLSRQEALAHIERVDKERRQWIRFLFDVEWDDPHLYDIVLNLGRMTLATASDLVAQLAERDDFKPTPESQKAMDNLALSTLVTAALARDRRTREAALDASSEDGVVTLKGQTALRGIADAAILVARQVEGVKEVRSEIVQIRTYPGT
jgi:cytidylate kinase